ncbi:MAG: sigma-70 family RNA polymerase sigma factor [Microscillaceae bacterium]|nr:sigma-70 family RNA polymerase sigma factor [Microscillaceae bacterium]
MTSSKPSLEEIELVAGLKQKNRRSFESLYQNYSPALYGLCLKVLKAEEWAQEALQDSFVKIWRKIDTYDESKGRLFTWILNIARNTAIDKLRSRAYQDHQQGQALENTRMAATENSYLVVEHIGLDSLVARLAPEHRQVIEAIYFGGLSHVEAAQKLDLPLGTLKSRVKIALRELRKLT